MPHRVLNPEQRLTLALAAQWRREIVNRIHQYLKTYFDFPHSVNLLSASVVQTFNLARQTELARVQAYFWQQMQLFDAVSALQLGCASGDYLGILRLEDGPPSLEIRDSSTGGDKHIYLLDEDGISQRSRIGIAPHYDPRERPWYQEARASAAAGWSAIYQYSTSTSVQLGITATLPVADENGECWGVLGCNLSLNQIGRFLRELQFGKQGTIFIVEPTGKLVATSSGRAPFTVVDGQAKRTRASHCGDRQVEAAIAHLQREYGSLEAIDSDGQLEFVLDEELQCLDVKPFRDGRGLQWAIVLVIPEADFSAELAANAGDPLRDAYNTLTKLNRTLEDRVAQRTAALKKSNEALRRSEERWHLALRGSNDGIWDWNIETDEVFYSPRWKRMLGYGTREISSHFREWSQRIHPEDSDRALEAVQAHLSRQTPFFTAEYRVRCKDGSYKWVLDRGQALWDETGKPMRMVGSRSDISDRKAAEEKLIHNALHDALTSLPNRTFFLERLQVMLQRARRDPELVFAVLFLDIDRFKVVNDSLGHLAGDRLLVQVGQRLQEYIRSSDLLARLGGDEFAILLEGVQSATNSIAVARRLLSALEEPFSLQGQQFNLGASIGIATSHNPATNSTYEQSADVLRDADLAMYQAKHRSSSGWELFDAHMHASMVTRMKLENDLQRALQESQLCLYYQPIVCLHAGQLRGVEALVRWQHPEWGLLSPGRFLAIAMETGAIVAVGEWVLREACQQMQLWQAASRLDVDATISVNVAGQQFAGDLVGTVEKALAETGCAPRHLCLEVVEDEIAANAETAIAQLDRLRQLGVQVSIDDFGTGHSSLSRLQDFPADRLKIDRSFIVKMSERPRNRKFVQSIVNIAHSLGLAAIAEGIETAQQQEILREMGCEYGQGYFFSPPLRDPFVQELQAVRGDRPRILS